MKLSSRIHIVNGSAGTGIRSRVSELLRRRACGSGPSWRARSGPPWRTGTSRWRRSSAVVSAASAAGSSEANSRTSRRVWWPLSERLSQLRMVTGSPWVRDRCWRPRTIWPIGRAGAGLRQIMLDIGVRHVQRTGCGAVGIAVFGDGEGHDPGCGRADFRDDAFGVFRRDEGVRMHPRSGEGRSFGRYLHHRVGHVLGMHGVGDGAGAAGYSDDAPVAAVGADGGVGVDGLVGAVEVSQSEVDDAGGRYCVTPDDSGRGCRQRCRLGAEVMVTSPSWSRRAHGRWAGRPACRGSGQRLSSSTCTPRPGSSPGWR